MYSVKLLLTMLYRVTASLLIFPLFCSFPYSDAFAMNATATSALALCVIPFGLEAKVEGELLHMLAGCVSTLNREGCILVGGHTSEGAEPALGLSGTQLIQYFVSSYLPYGLILIFLQ